MSSSLLHAGIVRWSLYLFCFAGCPFESTDVFAQAELCGSPPPTADETIKGEIKGRVTALSKYLGSAELGGQAEILKKEVLSQYPRADATVLRLL
jgi:hypothetical protein